MISGNNVTVAATVRLEVLRSIKAKMSPNPSLFKSPGPLITISERILVNLGL